MLIFLACIAWLAVGALGTYIEAYTIGTIRTTDIPPVAVLTLAGPINLLVALLMFPWRVGPSRIIWTKKGGE